MVYSFLGFELDEQLFELRHEGQVVATQTRVFGMIAYLLHHRDRVVGKDELIRELWQATVASDTAISQVVMLARKALGDEGDSQRIIKTVRGRGFRFIAEVRTLEAKPSKLAPPDLAVPAAASPAPSVAPKPADGLIGRSAELVALNRALASAEADQGRLVLIEGEPGIGKTSLASAFANEASARGVDVRWGRAWEAGGAPPYWPFVQVLRGMAQREGQQAMRRYMTQGAADIVGLMPEWSDGPVPAPLDASSLHARFRLFDAMARFLRNACSVAPAPNALAADGGSAASRARLIILDDLHAVDEASIELLRFLSSELQDIPLLIVATLRDLELASNPTLAQLAEMLDESQRIRLSGLSSSEISALVAQRVGQLASSQVIRVLHEVSGGNPLLLGVMCRHVGPAGLESFVESSTLASMTLPERMASAVRKQLSELPRATTDALSIASALGREFSTPMLAELCGIAEAELLVRLGPALGRGLLRQSSTSDQRAFSHALVHSAVYTELPGHIRLELHRSIAQLLEQQSQTAQPGRTPLFEIAHHYHQAAAIGCRKQALDYAQRAAKHACEMTAFEVAAGLYDRATGLAETQGSDPATLHDLLCGAGDAWYQAGQLAHAVGRYDRAAALARSEQHAERFASAVLRSANALRGGLLHNRARQQELLEALSVLPETDSEIRASLLAASALGMRGDQRLAARDASTQAAVEMARRLGNELTLLRTLTARHVALWGIAHPRVTLEIADEIVELGSKSNNHEQLLDALLFRIANNAELGDLPSLWHDYAQFAAEVAHRGSPWHAYMLAAFSAIEAAGRGDFANAEQLSVRALRQGLRVHDPLAAAYHTIRCLFLQIDRGVRHLAPSAAGASEPPDFVPPDYHPFWALWWVNCGERARAAHAMTQLLSHDWQFVVSDTLRRPLLALAGQVCAILDDRPHLERIYDMLRPDLGLHLLLQAGVSLGPISHHLGTIATALGRHDDAEAHLRQALNESAAAGPWYVRSQLAYGQLLAARGHARGRELLLEAEHRADQLGMRDLHEDIRQSLASIRVASSVAEPVGA
jgi:DNA-binding winged helix-turn-helix (wHTH) protein/tetratricopeptide (TPR) repeat protein